jgi:hypothetical protein
MNASSQTRTARTPSEATAQNALIGDTPHNLTPELWSGSV